MNSLVFYSVFNNYYDVVCKIIEKLYETKQNCLLLCNDKDQVDFFDVKLWTFSKISFIPHGNKYSLNINNAIFCHTWISEELDFYNNPVVLVNCAVHITKPELTKFNKIIDIFCGTEKDKAYTRFLLYKRNDYIMWEQNGNKWRQNYENFGS